MAWSPLIFCFIPKCKGCLESGLYSLVLLFSSKHLNLNTFLPAIFWAFWRRLAKLSEAHNASQLYRYRHLCPPDVPREWVRCWCTLWTAFHSVIPDLWHTQCPPAMRSNPKGLASIFSNGFTAVCWSPDGWRRSEQPWWVGRACPPEHFQCVYMCACVWERGVCVWVSELHLGSK